MADTILITAWVNLGSFTTIYIDIKGLPIERERNYQIELTHTNVQTWRKSEMHDTIFS